VKNTRYLGNLIFGVITIYKAIGIRATVMNISIGVFLTNDRSHAQKGRKGNRTRKKS
jgi:hypothetical protein